MGYKTILCHLRDTGDYRSHIAATMTLAANHGAHVVGLHVIEPLVLPVDPLSALPAEFYDRYEADAEAQANTIRDALLEAARRDGVSFEWRLGRGYREQVVKEHSPYADMIVVGRGTEAWAQEESDALAADLAMTTGRPVLYLPDGPAPASIGRKVLVAWNGSHEAARAVTDSMPFLKSAERVALVSARQPSSMTMDIGKVLARHDVAVITQNIEAAADARIGEMLLQEADRQQCDLLVMGVYGHSRMNEWVFGGVSRHILSHARVPLLLAH